MPEPFLRHARARRIATIGVGLATVAGLSLTAMTAQAAEPTTPIPHSKPGWLSKATHLGAPSSSAKTTARVYLAPRGGVDALKAAVTAISTPGSATYGHYLTPAQYRARYAPTSASVKAVEQYLRAAGLTVTGVESSSRYIGVSGDVAAAQKAFHTTLGRYKHAGSTVQAPSKALSLPSSLAPLVTTVTGLDTTPHKAKPAASTPVPPPAGYRNARPCSVYYGQVAAKYQADYRTPLPKFQGKTVPYSICGYTGPQFRAAYEGETPLTGKGVGVAIIDAYASPTIAKDANTYAKNHGDGAYTTGQLTQVTPAKYTNLEECDASGWFGEETLDVEAVHAMATDASIRYYGAASCYDDDLLDALNRVVDQDKVSIVSNSYGEPDEAETADGIAANEQAFLQAAAEGISVLFSSGDNGDELQNTGIKQTDSSASDPYVTAVGGTADAIGADGTFLGQTGWGTETYSLAPNAKSWVSGGYLYGAGGGSSTLFNKPAYQNGVASGSYRQVPDVAMDADPTTGMLVGETQTFTDGTYYDEYRIGGTSLASPLFAGITALTVQHAKHDLGFLNPVVYKLRSSAFKDITAAFPDKANVRANYTDGESAAGGLSYVLRTFGQDSSLAVTRGYDTVTGIGAPTPKWLTAVK